MTEMTGRVSRHLFKFTAVLYLILSMTARTHQANLKRMHQTDGEKTDDVNVQPTTSGTQTQTDDVTRGTDSKRLQPVEEGASLGKDEVITPKRPRVLRRQKRAVGVAKRSLRWPDAVVPYGFRKKHDFGKGGRKLIKEAMDIISENSCVSFRKAGKKDKDRISFVSSDGCETHDTTVGKRGGRQDVSVGRGCKNKRTIIHVLLHTLGFYDEQKRRDREKYIKDGNKKIDTSSKLARGISKTFGTPFDINSIMYRDNVNADSDGDWMTFWDIKGINTMYPCGPINECGSYKCEKNGFLDKNCTCKCENPKKDSTNPTIGCNYRMLFRSKKKKSHLNVGSEVNIVCAYPRSNNCRISRKGGKEMAEKERIFYFEAFGRTFYGGNQDIIKDRGRYMVIKQLKCDDAGVYTCQCQPRGSDSPVSKTWRLRVNGCNGVMLAGNN